MSLKKVCKLNAHRWFTSETRIASAVRATMKWRPRNFDEALLPLTTLQALIGHGVFHGPLGKLSLRCSIFYSVTVSTVYLASLCYAINIACRSDWLRDEDRTVMFVSCVHAGIWAFAGIISWYRRRKYIENIRRIEIIDESLNMLGEPCDYEATFRWGIWTVVGCLVGIVVATIVDYFWMHGKTSVGEGLFIAVTYHYPIHVNTIFGINLHSLIELIRLRFVKLNNVLERTLSATPADSGQSSGQFSWRKKSRSSGSLKKITVSSVRNSCETTKNLLQIIKHMHLELSNVPREIERSYGVQIALEMAANFVTLLGLLYNIYWFLMKQTQSRWLLHFCMMIFWFTMYFGKIIFMNMSCTRMISEAGRTGEIINDLKAVPSEEAIFRDDVRQFCLQMMLNPVSISPAGMFSLNNRFTTHFLATVVTYLVIFIEIGDESFAGE